MPETPAQHNHGFKMIPGDGVERLATPEELAEYGTLAPDRETEQKILALLEQQMIDSLTSESIKELAVGMPADAGALGHLQVRS